VKTTVHTKYRISSLRHQSQEEQDDPVVLPWFRTLTCNLPLLLMQLAIEALPDLFQCGVPCAVFPVNRMKLDARDAPWEQARTSSPFLVDLPVLTPGVHSCSRQ